LEPGKVTSRIGTTATDALLSSQAKTGFSSWHLQNAVWKNFQFKKIIHLTYCAMRISTQEER